MLAFKRNRYVYLYDTFDRPLAIWQLILELDSKIGGKCNKDYLLHITNGYFLKSLLYSAGTFRVALQ